MASEPMLAAAVRCERTSCSALDLGVKPSDLFLGSRGALFSASAVDSVLPATITCISHASAMHQQS